MTVCVFLDDGNCIWEMRFCLFLPPTLQPPPPVNKAQISVLSFARRPLTLLIQQTLSRRQRGTPPPRAPGVSAMEARSVIDLL